MTYRRFVQARMFQGLLGSEAVRFVVLTAPGGGVDLAVWNEGSAVCLKRCLRSLQREFGRFAYFWTAELQERGAVHFNVLLRGGAYIARGRLYAIAEASGFGRRVSVNLARAPGVVGVERDGVGKSGAYITKAVAYVTKGAPTWMSRRNLYGFSRDWAPEFNRRPAAPADSAALPDAERPAGVMYLSEAEAFGASHLGGVRIGSERPLEVPTV